MRLRAEADVAEADDAVDLLLLEVGEDGVEREQVAVDVRDEADAHVPLPYEGPERTRCRDFRHRGRCEPRRGTVWPNPASVHILPTCPS